MTPEQHAKAIEDAAVAYAETTHTQDSSGARQVLKAAIIAGVGAAPDSNLPTYTDDLELRYVEACEERDHLRQLLPRAGWQLVPVEPTEDMRLAMATHGVKHLEWAGDVYAAMLAAAPKP